MCVASAFDLDGMQEMLRIVTEQRNLFLGENSCASLGEFCLLNTLKAMSNAGFQDSAVRADPAESWRKVA
jgi:hypothetical protein